MQTVYWVSLSCAGGYVMNDPLAYFVVAMVAIIAFQLVDLRKVK